MRVAWKCVRAGAVCAGLSLCAAGQQGVWDSYVNARFQFVVDYPGKLLQPQREADNGDGREFHPRHGKANIAAYGSYVDAIYDAKERAKTMQEECADSRSAYVLIKPSIQAVSCSTKAGDVLYYRAITKRDRLAAVEAHYPAEEKAQWDPIVARMAKSLQLAKVDDDR